ncbi:hypothetical protein [Chryseobacterium sp. MA9]|uniref:hypothetical protein n=1 Tax=Chryseobacterium sp. MA9 TaxID=2966625 RepID=UPI0021072B04|nr:hypothetical protein [Chryseobacterium sp. MA9]UTX48891.1 hypothetical protein KIK00_01065 [Chryseobacterium sp. MA9]
MKKILNISVIIVTATIKAQIGILTPNISNGSVSIEFNNSENRGLIVPYVMDKVNISETGTIIYDTVDHKVKYLQTSDSWFDLSIDNTGAVDLSVQDQDREEHLGAKVSIAANQGVNDLSRVILALADNDKAMILPKIVEPHLNIIEPDAGMLVYDTKNKMLAVFNGTVWTFWKP